jgi:hypothetical protein
LKTYHEVTPPQTSASADSATSTCRYIMRVPRVVDLPPAKIIITESYFESKCRGRIMPVPENLWGSQLKLKDETPVLFSYIY